MAFRRRIWRGRDAHHGRPDAIDDASYGVRISIEKRLIIDRRRGGYLRPGIPKIAVGNIRELRVEHGTGNSTSDG